MIKNKYSVSSAYDCLVSQIDKTIQQAVWLEKVNEVLVGLFPQFPMKVVGLRGSKLAVWVPNGAWASRLRQAEPSIRESLKEALRQNHHWMDQEQGDVESDDPLKNIDEIVIRVARGSDRKIARQSVVEEPSAEAKMSNRTIPPEGILAIKQLLSSGVQSQALQSALLNLLKNCQQ